MRKDGKFMKKFLAIFLTAVFLVTIFATVALAANSVSSNKYTVSGSKTISVTTNFAPKYITFEISNCSGAVVGLVTVDKPDGSSYNNFVSYSSNGTIKKRVYSATEGTYTFHFSNSGTATVKVTISN
jgi:hypothetical protein